MGADGFAIDDMRSLLEAFKDEIGDHLSVAEGERNLIISDFEDGATTAGAILIEAESGVKKAGMMDSKFTDQGVEGCQFGGEIGGHGDIIFGSKDIKRLWVEDEGLVLTFEDIPIVFGTIGIFFIEIEGIGMVFGAISDGCGGIVTVEIDKELGGDD